MSTRTKNEKVKRSYLNFLKESDGIAEATIVAIERELSRWEAFSNHEDFCRFTANKAVAFKKYLEQPGKGGEILSASTRYHCLQHLRKFLSWLSTQSGYRSKLTADAISYLSLDRKTVQSLNSPSNPKWPTLEYVRKLTASIDPATEQGIRDRALIAFLLLSGIRDKAVATLPIGCFDPQSLEVRQRPTEGVDTKFGKTFTTVLLEFDDDLVRCVREWYNYLQTEKLFNQADPLFPRTKVALANESLTFESQGVEPLFWRGTGSIREILKVRAKAAGFDYYYPHSFRHAHVHLAMKVASSAEEIKAISQNIGHENVATTLKTYGTLDQHRVGEVVRSLSFKKSKKSKLSAAERQALSKLLGEEEESA